MFFISTTVNTVFNIYMTDVLKLSMILTSVVLLGTKAWDAINDPMMGAIVERTRSKWGKCRPYLLWIAAPLVITTAFLFLPVNFSSNLDIYNKNGEFLGNGGSFVFVLLMYMTYITAYTAIEIPYNSLTPLVFPQKDKRVNAVSVSNTLGSLGSILPSVLIWLFIGLLGNGKDDNTNWGYFWSALLFAAMGAGLIIWSFFGIKEKIYIPPRNMNARKSLKTILSDSRMRVLLLASFFMGCINIGAIFLPYFAKWNCIGILPMEKINLFLEKVLGKNPEIGAVAILPTLLSIMSGISYMLSMMIIPLFLKKMSKKTLWIWMSIIGAIACVMTYFIGIYLLPYNTLGGFVVYAILRFFTNFPVGMSTVLSVSMFADITDDLEMKTGERLEATAYSIKGLMYKLSMAIFNVAVLAIIDNLGYNADKMDTITNGAETPLIDSTRIASVIEGVDYTKLLNGIFFMLTALSAIGLILQAIPMFFYKFDEDEMEERLVEYRKRKEEEQEAEFAAALEASNAENN